MELRDKVKVEEKANPIPEHKEYQMQEMRFKV